MGIIDAFDLYRFYHTGEEETLALRGANIHVDSGEIVAVMGPSGSGKSTLMACLAGLDEPDGGYVELLGKRITRRPEAERAAIRAQEIGIVLQSGNLFNHLSVEENIRLQMQLGHKVDEERLTELLKQVGLDKRREARPTRISGGELARAALAVALANSPKVLMADEPTGEVDAETEKKILDLFENYRRNGGAAIIATHSEALAAHANRILRVFDGRIVKYD
ncbi:ABC-type antimicrobial peptide transport system, ATPase component [Desulfosporosinus acidiphilus SJ4]|uniref:ABC-type antimicrobial peptide transport system, ATPase component n=1 Tax=Desulfosporosinus acidiphilus (strain DSM 22704 / JCM 16185 / SJ4) TaxID=646529 RepID=I4DB81_DESAJ|nr:ABC transporter ATP-binding protein [Desulfosporosinus acidiphilus]AFM43055.1 ABC-type antimicrobial peptide transport system, ATPase component [Desulfosporosinus acidiphilus SJ4]